MIELTMNIVQNGWLEATWVNAEQLPDTVIAAKPALFDEDGNEVQAAVPETIEPGRTLRTDIKHTSYHQTQLDLLQADAMLMSTPLEEHEAMLNAWVAAYEPEPANTDLIIAEVVAATQARLDAFARTRNYDGILSACTYATSSIQKFNAEGQYCVQARDNTWAALYAFMDEVQTGTRQMPSGFAEVEAVLPTIKWPAS